MDIGMRKYQSCTTSSKDMVGGECSMNRGAEKSIRKSDWTT